MSKLGCHFPEIDEISKEFTLSKVVGRYQGHKGKREILEAVEIPINRRFSSSQQGPVVQKIVKTTGLPTEDEMLPAYMSIKSDFEIQAFSGKYENVRTRIFEKTNKKIKEVLETKKSTFTNVVDIDDSEFDSYIKTNLACKFGESGFFKLFMLAIVMLNTLCLALQTNPEYAHSTAIEVIDVGFQGIFIFEVCLKWYYGFKVYWKSAWNWFDFTLAAIPVLGPSFAFLSAGKTLKVIRVFKVFRSLRAIQSFENLLRITQSIGRSIPEIINILLLLVILMIVFSIAAVDILNTDDFASFDVAMFSLFQVTTQDGWVKLVQRCKDIGQSTEAYLFFLFFVILAVFVLQNLIIAAIVNNTQETFNQVKRTNLKKVKKLTSAHEVKEPNFYDKTAVFTKPKEREVPRVPVQVLRNKTINKKKLNEICLLVGILENLYCEIETKSKILQEIHESIKHNEMRSNISSSFQSTQVLEELDALTSLLKSKQ